jgi:predicted nucleotidyltransferase
LAKTGQEVEGIIKAYLSTLSELGVRAERALLYGSYARGLAREESDIDLIVVSEDFEGMNIRERLEVLGMSAARIMQPVQARGYTPQEIESGDKDPFLVEVLAHSKAAV